MQQKIYKVSALFFVVFYNFCMHCTLLLLFVCCCCDGFVRKINPIVSITRTLNAETVVKVVIILVAYCEDTKGRGRRALCLVQIIFHIQCNASAHTIKATMRTRFVVVVQQSILIACSYC